VPDWLAIVILGVIEGVTEFLPVSSTGHLLIAEHWLPRQSELFNVVIQSGAVLAVLLNFWARLKQLGTGWREREHFDYLLKLAVAFLVTGVGGLVLKKLGLKLPESLGPVAWATLIGGVLFIVVEQWLRGRPVRDEITWAIAVTLGAAQLIAAVFPGASRSGTTILIALVLGVSRPRALEFSFLLGVPTLLAAGALTMLGELKHGGAGQENWGFVVLGTLVSAVTAFVTVKWLLRFVQTHTFTAFGWYRVVLGSALIVKG